MAEIEPRRAESYTGQEVDLRTIETLDYGRVMEGYHTLLGEALHNYVGMSVGQGLLEIHGMHLYASPDRESLEKGGWIRRFATEIVDVFELPTTEAKITAISALLAGVEARMQRYAIDIRQRAKEDQ